MGGLEWSVFDDDWLAVGDDLFLFVFGVCLRAFGEGWTN